MKDDALYSELMSAVKVLHLQLHRNSMSSDAQCSKLHPGRRFKSSLVLHYERVAQR